MIVSAKEIVLKDGRKCILRCATKNDAQAMLDYLKVSSEETEYLLRYPDEVDSCYTLEGEKQFLEQILHSKYDIMLAAEVDGKIVGNACINGIGNKRKILHRGSFGIALMKDFWGLGIGKELMSYIFEVSDNLIGYELVDLEVVSENKRAICLYEKMGFKKIGERPYGLKLDNGNYFSEVLMCRRKGE